MIVGEVMSKEPYSIDASESLERALQILAETDVRHLPVVSDGELVGIISDRDLQRFLVSPLDELENPDAARTRMKQAVSNVMNADVVTAREEDELGEVVDAMIENRIGAVPVVAADSDQLVGIVSYVDVLRAARDSI